MVSGKLRIPDGINLPQVKEEQITDTIPHADLVHPCTTTIGVGPHIRWVKGVISDFVFDLFSF